MTLMAAVASGRAFKHATSDSDEFYTVDTLSTGDYSVSELTSEDWVLEPVVVAKTITLSELESAWNSAAAGFTSVKGAASSPLYAALKSRIFGS